MLHDFTNNDIRKVMIHQIYRVVQTVSSVTKRSYHLKSYKHILVATDLSPESKQAVARAKDMANRTNAEVSIIHIVEFSPVMYGGGEFAIPLNGDIEKSIQNQAEESLEKLANEFGIPADHLHIETGNTSEILMDKVQNLGIDLLLLGRHEHHGLGMLLGSTSNSMLHLMPCDVLAIMTKSENK